MNERERILDLVKKGVISSEEALVLLENLAKQQGTQAGSPADDTAPEAHSEQTETDDQSTQEQQFRHNGRSRSTFPGKISKARGIEARESET